MAIGGTTQGQRGGAGARLLVFLVVVFASLALAWMVFLPAILTQQLRKRTGFEAKVESLAANPFAGTLEIRGLVVTNPPTFPEQAFLEVREFSADAEMFSLLSDRIVFSSVVLDASRVTIVRRDGTQTNAGALAGYLSGGAANGGAHPAKPKEFLVRRLIVRIDEIVVIDPAGKAPARQAFAVSLNESYANVTGLRQLFTPSTLRALVPVGSALDGFLPGVLGQAVGELIRDTTAAGGKMLKGATRSAGEKFNGYFDALEESKKP